MRSSRSSVVHINNVNRNRSNALVDQSWRPAAKLVAKVMEQLTPGGAFGE
jgi:hypothetical protein